MGVKYKIFAGRQRRGDAISAFLDKNGQPQGKEVQVQMRVGVCGIPNGTRAYGVRLGVDGKIPKDTVINVEDSNYSGKIEWLKWGDPRGVPIDCRYIPGCPTLDLQYQKLRLRLEPKEQDEYAALITFPWGNNEFDEDLQPQLVWMFKLHHLNVGSVYKNPDIEETGMMFEELPEFNAKSGDQELVTIDKKTECLLLVGKASSNPEMVKTLFEIVRGTEFKGVNTEDASKVFGHLKIFADQDPVLFADRVDGYKKQVSDTIEKAKSFDLLDLTQAGKIVSVSKKGDREILIDNVPGKKEAMLDWVLDNFIEPNVFTGIDRLKAITDKIK